MGALGDLEARVVDALKVNVDQANENLLDQVINASEAVASGDTDVNLGAAADQLTGRGMEIINEINDLIDHNNLTSDENAKLGELLEELKGVMADAGLTLDYTMWTDGRGNEQFKLTVKDGDRTVFGFNSSRLPGLDVGGRDWINAFSGIRDAMRDKASELNAKWDAMTPEEKANVQGQIYWDGKTADLDGTAGVALLEFAKNAIQNVNTNLSGMGAQPEKARKVTERFIGSINA